MAQLRQCTQQPALSVGDNAPAASGPVTSNGTDFLSITETLLTIRKTSEDLNERITQGFSFFQKPEEQQRGGGEGLFMSSAHKISIDQSANLNKFCVYIW